MSDLATLPAHIAIVMDGNNRYGKQHGLPVGAGHLQGKKVLDPIVEHCRKLGVSVLTVFAFSSENWARPPDEIALLMALLQTTIHEQLPKMHEHGIRLRFIGDRDRLDTPLQRLMADAEAQTAHYKQMTLVIALSYGGQDDIATAAKALAYQIACGDIAPEDITKDTIANHIALGDCPPVDMFIRTGGEWRLSNFLLWQSAYAELFFSETLWPDFSVSELDTMLHQYSKRERRFGKTSEQLTNNQAGSYVAEN